MAPTQVTTDFYLVLEVCQTDTLDTITKSYKKLALKHHPDRNRHHDATRTFQQIGEAYETLKDPTKRRDYDRIYPTINKTAPNPPSSHSNPQTKPPPTTSQSPDTLTIVRETAIITNLTKTKQERAKRWDSTRLQYANRIFDLNRDIRKLKLAIQEFENKDKAEDAVEAAANSWSTWAFSLVGGKKKPVMTEEEKEVRKRERLQRLHSKGFKERELEKIEKDLKAQEDLLGHEKTVFENANSRDDATMDVSRERIRLIWQKEQEERDRVRRVAEQKARMEEYERLRVAQAKAAKERKERQEREQKEFMRQMKEAQEEQERNEARIRENEARVREEQEARWKRNAEAQDMRDALRRAGRATTTATTSAATSCIHDGWWPKIQGRRNCGRCGESWTYLLQCPGCSMKACPRCQADLRPRGPNRNRPKPNNSTRFQQSTPSSGWESEDDPLYSYHRRSTPSYDEDYYSWSPNYDDYD